MIRWLQLLLVAAVVLALLQAVILAATEPAARRRFAAELGPASGPGPLEQRLAAWRRRRRRQLWLNVVALPCLVLFALILVGEFG